MALETSWNPINRASSWHASALDSHIDGFHYTNAKAYRGPTRGTFSLKQACAMFCFCDGNVPNQPDQTLQNV